MNAHTPPGGTPSDGFLRWWMGPLLLGAALAWCGCAGYRLGPTNGLAAGSRTLQVNLFQNLTPEPRLSEPVASALRRRVQQDGSFRLATQNDGDIVLSGSITRFERLALSFDPKDVITPRDLSASLYARVTAIERTTGRVVLEREVWGRTTLRVGSDLAIAERQALPLLAEDLARMTIAALVEGRW
jgi:hypothetical protein